MTPTPGPQLSNSSALPVQKVVAGTLAGALSTIVVYILDHAFQGQFMITGEVAAAITTVFTFLISYLTPPTGVGSAPATAGFPQAQPPAPVDLNQLMSGVVQAALAGVAHGTASAQQQPSAAAALAGALSSAPATPANPGQPAPNPIPIKPLGMQP